MFRSSKNTACMLLLSILCCGQSLGGMVAIKKERLKELALDNPADDLFSRHEPVRAFSLNALLDEYLIILKKGTLPTDMPSLDPQTGERNYDYINNGNYAPLNETKKVGDIGDFFDTKQNEIIQRKLSVGKNPFSLTTIPLLIESPVTELAQFPIPVTFATADTSNQFTIACNNILDEDLYNRHFNTKTNSIVHKMSIETRQKNFKNAMNALMQEVQPDIICFQGVKINSNPPAQGAGYVSGGDLVIQFNPTKFTLVETRYSEFIDITRSRDGGLLCAALEHHATGVIVFIINIHVADSPGKIGLAPEFGPGFPFGPDDKPIFNPSDFRVKQIQKINKIIDKVLVDDNTEDNFFGPMLQYSLPLHVVVCGDFNTDLQSKAIPRLYEDVFRNTLLTNKDPDRIFKDAASALTKENRFTAFNALTGEAENGDYVFYTPASLSLISPVKYFTTALLSDSKRVQDELLTYGARTKKPQQDAVATFHSAHAILVATFALERSSGTEIDRDLFEKINTDLRMLNAGIKK